MSKNRQEAFEALLREHFKKKSAKAPADCPDENMITAYLEGLLPQRLREDLEKHAALCSRCQEELVLLLKSQSSPRVVSSQEGSPVEHAKGNWLASILGGFEWVHSRGLKPALAIFVATVISGYVGYELFQQRQERKEQFAEVLQSAPDATPTIKEKEPGSREPELGQVQQKKAPSGQENESETNRRSVTVAKKPIIHSKPANSPPVTVPGAPRDEDEEKLSRDNPRFDLTKSSETDKVSSFKTSSERPAKEKPKTLLQPAARPGSVAEQETEALNALKQSPAPPESNVATTQPFRENHSVSTKGSSSAPSEGQTKNDNKTKDAASSQKARAAGLLAGNSRLKLETVADTKALSADPSSEGKKPMQIEVSGKTFELRNNVWVDLSIEEKEKKNLTFIYKNSSRYQEQIKPLAPYQPVLSRPEDCLIQHEGKIYYVKRSP